MKVLSLGRIGTVDRIVRGVLGVAALVVALTLLSGVPQIILAVLGGVTLIEGLIGFCPGTYMRRRAADKKAGLGAQPGK